LVGYGLWNVGGGLRVRISSCGSAGEDLRLLGEKGYRSYIRYLYRVINIYGGMDIFLVGRCILVWDYREG